MKNTDKLTLTIGQLKKLIKEAKESSKTWYGVPGTKWIWHGEWADPEVEYDDETINANELENFAWGIYVKDCEAEGKKPSEDEFDNLPVKFFKDALDDYMFGKFGDGIDESYEDRRSEFANEERVIVNSLDKISNQLNKVLSSARFGSENFQSSIKTALNSINTAKRSYMI